MLSSIALLGVVVSALRSGVFDVRPKHAPPSEPEWLSAVQEPFWFYGTTALLSAFSVLVLVVGLRIIRETRRS